MIAGWPRDKAEEMTEVSTSSDIATLATSHPVCTANVILNVANQPSYLGSRPPLSQLVSMGLGAAAKQASTFFEPMKIWTSRLLYK